MKRPHFKNNKVPMVVILSPPRSGSTLLHNILGQNENMHAVGESVQLLRFIQEKRKCGCGEIIDNCSFWQPIIEHIGLNELEKPIADRYLPFFLTPIIGNFLSIIFRNKISFYKKLYEHIHNVSNGKIIVDSSKSVLHAFFLSKIDAFDVRAIHLIRDPRGVENSMYRRKLKGAPRYKNHKLILNSLKMDLKHFSIYFFLKISKIFTSTILYEDMMLTSAQNLNPFEDLRVSSEAKSSISNKLNLKATHSVGGSPSRFNLGKIEFKVDDSWKTLPNQRKKLIERISFTYKKLYSHRNT